MVGAGIVRPRQGRMEKGRGSVGWHPRLFKWQAFGLREELEIDK
jgi:hypothetical protein